MDPNKAGLVTHLMGDSGPVHISYQNYDWSINSWLVLIQLLIITLLPDCGILSYSIQKEREFKWFDTETDYCRCDIIFAHHMCRPFKLYVETLDHT